MPRHAIETGAVDFVLSPEGIARKLLRVARHPNLPAEQETRAPGVAGEEEDLLTQLFVLLREVSGQDFSGYKRATFKRRLERRMSAHKLESLGDYLGYARKEPAEAEALYHELLIGVTEFFRDPDTFDFLKAEVFPQILGRETRKEGLRFWVAGCSTGKEAYSVAMALLESADGPLPPIRIFATDINERDITIARAGYYPAGIASEVSTDRLARFFTAKNGGYAINQDVRDLCTFARHDVTRDPPFANLDFLSCRNLLIYFEPALQERAIKIFHYALRLDGFLLLGRSETIARQTKLFQVVEKTHHVYKKLPAPGAQPVVFSTPSAGRMPEPVAPAPESPVGAILDSFDAQREADRVVASAYASSSILVNEAMEVIAFRGSTAAYLEHHSGKASLDLFLLAREGLAHDLRKALEKARKTSAPVRKENVRVKNDRGWAELDLEVIPFKASDRRTYFVVVFREKGEPGSQTALKAERTAEAAQAELTELAMVREELEAAREHVQEVLHEKDTSLEEVRASYEELQSTNEELQSTNEELETAKEELQSVNEELTTVNDELEQRNDQLRSALDDISNILASVNLPIVILDDELRIRRFTPGTEEILHMIPSDVGRPITHIALKVSIPDLGQFLNDAISSLTPASRQVQTEDGRFFSVRVRPYRTSDKRIEGAVLSFVDVDDLTRALARVQEASTLSTALNEVNVAISSTLELGEIMRRVLDRAARVLAADSGGIMLPSGAGWSLEFFHPTSFASASYFSDDEVPQVAEARRTRSPVVITDPADPRLPSAFRERFNVASELVMPLRIRDEVIGVLVVNREPGRVAFGEAELDFAGKLAASVSFALENARLYEEVVETARLNSVLSEILARMAAAREVDATLKETLERAAIAIDSDRALFAHGDEGKWRIVQVHGFPEDLVGRAWGAKEAQAFPAVNPPTEPLVISRPVKDKRFEAGFVKEQGLGPVALVPLAEEQTLDGLILFAWPEGAAELNGAGRDFLRKLGAAVALALGRARHYEAEHRLAESLRQRLSPKVPMTPGLDIAAVTRTAAEIERVGGDFYDVFPTPDGRVALLVGDVTGKGLPAASLTDAIRSSMRTLAVIDPSPAFILDSLNRALRESTESPDAATAVLVVLDVASGTMEIATAGHPPAIVCSTSCRLLDAAPAAPLGFNRKDYGTQTAVLRPGEVLVLYTDGLSEARRGDELLGERRIVSALEQRRSKSAKQIAEGLLEDALEFASGRLHDDVALLVVRRDG